jgi:trimethylamine:corrinoid methyltransferase-like protein
VRFSQLAVLDQNEIETVHARSLEILEKAGVRVHDPECRAALAKAGAKAEPNGEKVYLPGRLVEQCLGERSPNRYEDSLLARAHARVEQLLSTHTPTVPEHIVNEVRRWALRGKAACNESGG